MNFTSWVGAIQTLVGGALFIAGLIAWHIATGDMWGFYAALVAAGAMWISGNLLIMESRFYAAPVALSFVAAVVSALFVGI